MSERCPVCDHELEPTGIRSRADGSMVYECSNSPAICVLARFRVEFDLNDRMLITAARCRAVCEALDAVLENPAMQDKPITLDGPSDNLVRSACRAVVERERAKWEAK